MKKIAILFSLIATLNIASAQNKKDDIILSVNAYSFSDVLSAREPRDKQQVFSYFNLLDWCATQNIKALDATAYFFSNLSRSSF